MQSNEKLGNEVNEQFSNLMNSGIGNQTKKLLSGFESDFKKFLETNPEDNSVQGFMKFLSEKEN